MKGYRSTSTLLQSIALALFLCSECTGKQAKQPVIIDTDVGSDFDDGVAIAFAVQSQDIDVRMIVTCTDDTTARAKIAAKLLTLYGRDDIPIGIGLKNDNKTDHSLFDWAKDFDLQTYKGGVWQDGIGKMGELILMLQEVTIMSIGPATNFPTLISRFPQVTGLAEIRAMGGSIAQSIAEYNVMTCPYCWSLMLHAGWNVSTTPLDTSGLVRLPPSLMQVLLASSNPISLGISNSLIYFCITNSYMNCEFKSSAASPTLYDTVATLLTLPQLDEFIVMKVLNITVTEDGHTKVDDKNGVPVNVALYWQENDGLSRYETFLVNALAGN